MEGPLRALRAGARRLRSRRRRPRSDPGRTLSRMGSDVILVIVIGAALAFDFTNGFHDTANVVATGISTRAIGPKQAVTGAAILNFAGAFLSLSVAATVASGLV